MTDWTIRQAVPDDTPHVVEVLRRWIDETPWMPMLHDRADMEGFWGRQIAESHALCGISQGQVCGFAVRDGEWLNALYLNAGNRNQGLGAALLAEAKRQTPILRLWAFQANHGALQFYTRHGFAEVKRTDGDNEEGLPDVQMEWRSNA